MRVWDTAEKDIPRRENSNPSFSRLAEIGTVTRFSEDQIKKKGGYMPTRNTVVLERIVKALGNKAPHDALARMEDEFKDSLLVVAGDTNDVARHAEHLRLAITTEECAVVLDHLAPQIRISLDQTEEAINTLFPDRFIEP